MDFGVFQDAGSERANSISSGDLDPFLLQGDEQTWAVEDWNWDPFNMFAAPKEVPNVACCQALKKRKASDNTATSGNQQQLQSIAAQYCHGASGSHRPGAPASPAAACCSVAAGFPSLPAQQATHLQEARYTFMPTFKCEPEAVANTGCHFSNMVAPPPAMPVATGLQMAGLGMGPGLGMGMGMGLQSSMGWPGVPNMGGAVAAAASAANSPAFFAKTASGRGTLAAMGLGNLPMSGLAFSGPHAPALAMSGSAFQAPSSVLDQHASLALPPSALPSPLLGSSCDTGSLQGSADNAKPPCCSGVRAGGGPTSSGGRQQADSSNMGNAPAPSNYHMGGRGASAAAPGDVSDIPISDSEEEREEMPRRGGRGGAAQQRQLHALADLVALQDVGDDSGICQVPGCGKDLSNLKEYHQRYRICDVHIKLQQVMKDGRLQRFCQQCGRFHDLTAFDGNRKSCREQLSKHNARRRRRTGVEPPKGKAVAVHDTSSAAAAATVAVGPGASFEGDIGKLVSTLMSNPTQLHALKLLLGVPTHPALPAAQPIASMGVCDSSSDASASDQARTYGLARDILAGRNEFAPVYTSEHRTVRLSMKLFNRTPADLPADLRNQVASWLASSPAAMEASIRPGCVFLTVQMLVDEAGAAQAEAPGAASSLVEHLLKRTDCPLWHSGRVALQLGSDIVLLRDGQPARCSAGWAIGKGGVRFPTVQRLGLRAAVAGRPTMLQVHGENLDAPGCTVILRWGSKHIEARLQPLSSRQAFVRLPPLPDMCGPVWLEVARGPHLSAAKQLLVVRDEALVEEVNKLGARDGPLASDTLDVLLRDLALVLQYIAREASVALQLPTAAIATKARRLLAIACDMGWAAVASAVLPLACSSCSCAAEVVAAIHAASEPPSASTASPSTSMSADPRGLSLLHRAVRGGSLPLLAGVLAWSNSNGYRWSVDAAGPAGITPLHLCVLLDDARVALLLLDHYNWSAALTALRSDCGVTPFQLAFQMGRCQINALVAALGGLQLVDGGAAPQLRTHKSGTGPGAMFGSMPDEGANLKPDVCSAAAGHHRDGCSGLQPWEACHCALPPALLSIMA